MRGVLLRIVAVLFVATIAGTTLAQESPHQADAKAGREFAQNRCDACHIIGMKQEFPPPMAVDAPSFLSIAKRPDTTAQSLQIFLSRTHAYSNMPAPAVRASDAADVIAYVLSLRSRH